MQNETGSENVAKGRDLDAVTSQYHPNAVTEVENDLVLKWYPHRIASRIGKCGRLLELGLGHGITAMLFHEHCREHVIIEGSPRVIGLFKDKHPDFSVTIVHEYFETFASDQLFDCIIMGFVLEHVENPDMIVERYRKLLKPEGVLYITVPNAKSLNRRLGFELGKINDIYELNANDLALGHKRQFCRDTLRDLLKRNGFSITYEEGIYLKPLPLSILKTLPDFKENLQAMLRVGVDFPDLCVALLMEARIA